jgi:hypothetical protein
MTVDKITNLGSSGVVDDSILRIQTVYDSLSRPVTITSYSTA